MLLSFGIVVLSAIGILRIDRNARAAIVSPMDKGIRDTDTVDTVDEALAVLYDETETETDSADETAGAPMPPHRGDEQPVSGDARANVLKETPPVGDEYFETALFIGDSRMAGLSMSCKDSAATFYAAVALSINQLNTKKAIQVSINGETSSITVMEAIERDEKAYDKIYLMFGLNELGWSYPSVFIKSMKSTIDRLSEIYPNADFCIMAIMPVSSDATVSIYKGNDANERIREYNQMLLELACENGYYYLDTYELFADETGSMPADYVGDGVHLYSDKNQKLMDYVKNHAIIGGTADSSAPIK